MAGVSPRARFQRENGAVVWLDLLGALVVRVAECFVKFVRLHPNHRPLLRPNQERCLPRPAVELVRRSIAGGRHDLVAEEGRQREKGDGDADGDEKGGFLHAAVIARARLQEQGKAAHL